MSKLADIKTTMTLADRVRQAFRMHPDRVWTINRLAEFIDPDRNQRAARRGFHVHLANVANKVHREAGLVKLTENRRAVYVLPARANTKAFQPVDDPALAALVAEALLSQPDRAWSYEDIAQKLFPEGSSTRRQLPQAVALAIAKIGWVRRAHGPRRGMFFMSPEVALATVALPGCKPRLDRPRTLAERIQRALETRPLKAWTIAELEVATRPHAVDPRLALEIVACAAKPIALRLGWIKGKRRRGTSTFTIYSPPPAEDDAEAPTFEEVT